MRFEHFSFGSIEIDGVTYEHDVVIDRGEVHKRKKKPSKKFRDAFGHTPLSMEEEIPWKCRRLVVGTGAYGGLPVMKRGEDRNPATQDPPTHPSDCSSDRGVEAGRGRNQRDPARDVLKIHSRQPSRYGKLKLPSNGGIMEFRNRLASSLLAAALVTVLGCSAHAQEKSATIRGYVLDSACAFIKNLDKPISRECALSCAKAGSPLVILGDDGIIYWPISDAMPATGQNVRLIKFAWQKVTVAGKVFEHGGSRGVVIERIERAPTRQ